MTNKEVFMMVFGKNPENLKRRASTIDWWDQEFIGLPPDCANEEILGENNERHDKN